MITDTITQKIAEALKAGDEIKLSTLRLLSSALNYEFIAKQHKLSAEEEMVVVRREVKKRKDAIESLKLAIGKQTGHTEEEIKSRIAKEETELNILTEYLPPETSGEDLVKLVDEVIAETGAKELKDIGRVIGIVMKKAGGAADGAKVAEMVKKKLL